MEKEKGGKREVGRKVKEEKMERNLREKKKRDKGNRAGS